MFNRKVNVNITEGVIWKQLIIFAVPLLISNLFQQLYTSVDTLIVGRYVGSQAMAAVGSTGALVNLVVGIFVGVTTGAGVVISQYYGASDSENVSKAIHTGVVFSIFSGLFITVIGVLFSENMLRLMKCPDDVIGMSTEYLRIYFVGTLFALLYNIGSRTLIASGDSRRPLYYLMISSAINVILDYIFVAIFKFGVAGAAWATIISQIVSAILVLYNLLRTDTMCRLMPIKLFHYFNWSMLWRIIKIGIPTGMQSVMYSISNMVIQTQVNTFGSAVMAGCTAGGTINGFVYMPIAAMGLAISTFVGQNIGAGKFDRVRESCKSCMIMTVGITIVTGGISALFGRQLVALFNNDPEVIKNGIIMMVLVTTTYWIYAITEVLSGVLRGAGSALAPMIICLLGICVCRIIWIYAVTPIWYSIIAIYLAYPISWAITDIALIIYYYKGKWLKRDI